MVCGLADIVLHKGLKAILCPAHINATIVDPHESDNQVVDVIGANQVVSGAR